MLKWTRSERSVAVPAPPPVPIANGYQIRRASIRQLRTGDDENVPPGQHERRQTAAGAERRRVWGLHRLWPHCGATAPDSDSGSVYMRLERIPTAVAGTKSQQTNQNGLRSGGRNSRNVFQDVTNSEGQLKGRTKSGALPGDTKKENELPHDCLITFGAPPWKLANQSQTGRDWSRSSSRRPGELSKPTVRHFTNKPSGRHLPRPVAVKADSPEGQSITQQQRRCTVGDGNSRVSGTPPDTASRQTLNEQEKTEFHVVEQHNFLGRHRTRDSVASVHTTTGQHIHHMYGEGEAAPRLVQPEPCHRQSRLSTSLEDACDQQRRRNGRSVTSNQPPATQRHRVASVPGNLHVSAPSLTDRPAERSPPATAAGPTTPDAVSSTLHTLRPSGFQLPGPPAGSGVARECESSRAEMALYAGSSSTALRRSQLYRSYQNVGAVWTGLPYSRRWRRPRSRNQLGRLADYPRDAAKGWSLEALPGETVPRNRLQDGRSPSRDSSTQPSAFHPLGSRGRLKLRIYENSGLVTVHVVSARHLRCRRHRRRRRGSSVHSATLYVKVMLVSAKVGGGGSVCRTRPVHATSSPRLDERFSFDLAPQQDSYRAKLSVWRRRTPHRRSELLGCASVRLTMSALTDQPIAGWFQLKMPSTVHRVPLDSSTLSCDVSDALVVEETPPRTSERRFQALFSCSPVPIALKPQPLELELSNPVKYSMYHNLQLRSLQTCNPLRGYHAVTQQFDEHSLLTRVTQAYQSEEQHELPPHDLHEQLSSFVHQSKQQHPARLHQSNKQHLTRLHQPKEQSQENKLKGQDSHMQQLEKQQARTYRFKEQQTNLSKEHHTQTQQSKEQSHAHHLKNQHPRIPQLKEQELSTPKIDEQRVTRRLKDHQKSNSQLQEHQQPKYQSQDGQFPWQQLQPCRSGAELGPGHHQICIPRKHGGFGFSLAWTRPPRVVRVAVGMSASEAGLRPGDTTLRIGGQDVTRMHQTDGLRLVQRQRDVLELEIFRPPEDSALALLRAVAPQHESTSGSTGGSRRATLLSPPSQRTGATATCRLMR